MKHWLPFLLLGSVAVMLSACTEGTPVPPEIPTGMQTMTGTLLPAEITTLRRGSHKLMVEDQTLCFVESTTVNLRAFEGKRIVIRGIFEPNTDPTMLPVLVTQDVTAVEQDLVPFSLPSLGLTGQTPRTWIKATQQNSTLFLLEGSATPLLAISVQKQSPLPTTGAPFIISGFHAVRQSDSARNEETVSIEYHDDLIVIVFRAPEGEDSDLLRAQWGAFLTTLSLAGSTSSTQTSSSAAPSDGVPCGGTAGILCPAGQYCAITDMKENIGHCRPVN